MSNIMYRLRLERHSGTFVVRMRLVVLAMFSTLNTRNGHPTLMADK